MRLGLSELLGSNVGRKNKYRLDWDLQAHMDIYKELSGKIESLYESNY